MTFKNFRMKLFLLIIIVLVCVGTFFIFKDNNSDTNEQYVDFSSLTSKPKKDKNQKKSGPLMEIKYFEQQHYPYGHILKPELLKSIWSEINNAPNETDFSSPVTSWTPIGPYGSQITSTNTRFTGRIIDIHAKDTANLKIAAASGGLWRAGSPLPIAMTEQLTSQAASTFDIQPGNNNVIILGTGEPWVRGGTGMYRTTNGGLNWSSVLINDTVHGVFYKIRYSNANVVHAITQRGYYRSDDNGLNWSIKLAGDISDIAINPTDNNIIYCCRKMDTDHDSGGVYKTINNGSSWIRMTNGIPITNVGRMSISISKSNPSYVYVLMSKRDGYMAGIYRTSGADIWTNVSPPEEIFGSIGWYCNEIAVSPVTPTKVIAGGIWLWRTTNLGITWSKYDNNININIHADQHSIVWDSTGTSVWVGNDGGLAYSDDEGLSYTTLNNRWPITQYYNVDVALSNTNVFMGGSQDNGITSTTNGGTSWRYNISWGGDGSGAAISPFNADEMYMTIGVYGNPWYFRRHRTTNGGVNWVELNSGIDPSQQWYTRIKTDNINPITVFTSSDNFLYYSTNKGDNWLKRNTTGFADDIWNFSIRKYNDTSIVYAVTQSRTTGERIYVQSGTSAFTERSGDLLDGYYINYILMHPSNSNMAYAVIKGIYNGQKVYKTTNRGVNWTNISANLPNVPALSMTIYPNNDNILYL